MLKVTCNLSSGYHPQTDGQAERTNQMLEQDDWADILHFAELSYNNSIHLSTRITPFYVYIGYHPRWCLFEAPKLPMNCSAHDHLD